MKVYTDKTHEHFSTICLLEYDQQETMKRFWHVEGSWENSFLVHYAHYSRFLSSIEEVCEIGPSFREYIEWKKEFPGWSYGVMRPTHSAWRANCHKESFPMNEFYMEKKVSHEY